MSFPRPLSADSQIKGISSSIKRRCRKHRRSITNSCSFQASLRVLENWDDDIDEEQSFALIAQSRRISQLNPVPFCQPDPIPINSMDSDDSDDNDDLNDLATQWVLEDLNEDSELSSEDGVTVEKIQKQKDTPQLEETSLCNDSTQVNSIDKSHISIEIEELDPEDEIVQQDVESNHTNIRKNLNSSIESNSFKNQVKNSYSTPDSPLTADNRQERCIDFFNHLNARVFANRLTCVPVEWSNRLHSTAGKVNLIRHSDNTFEAKINLSASVLTTQKRLENTLAHEMCHAACWVIDNINGHHGPKWKKWTKIVSQEFPFLEITTKHTYELDWKYRYICQSCQKVYGRNKPSINTQKKCCGVCKGKLLLSSENLQISNLFSFKQKNKQKNVVENSDENSGENSTRSFENVDESVSKKSRKLTKRSCQLNLAKIKIKNRSFSLPKLVIPSRGVLKVNNSLPYPLHMGEEKSKNVTPVIEPLPESEWGSNVNSSAKPPLIRTDVPFITTTVASSVAPVPPTTTTTTTPTTIPQKHSKPGNSLRVSNTTTDSPPKTPKRMKCARIPSKRFQTVWAEACGRRPTMEDALFLFGNFNNEKNQDLFGVFDGHGGNKCSQYSCLYFPLIFQDFLKKTNSIEKSFLQTHKELDKAIKGFRGGTTSCLAFFDKNTIHLANCGDTRAVLATKLSNGGFKATQLTTDHKPSLPSEENRIKSVGGWVEDDRVYGELGVARAIGDSSYGECVTCVPQLYSYTMVQEDSFLILACDGVWDVLTNQQAVDCITNTTLENRQFHAAQRLVQRAYKLGSTDNISCIVIGRDLKSF